MKNQVFESGNSTYFNNIWKKIHRYNKRTNFIILIINGIYVSSSTPFGDQWYSLGKKSIIDSQISMNDTSTCIKDTKKSSNQKYLSIIHTPCSINDTSCSYDTNNVSIILEFQSEPKT